MGRSSEPVILFINLSDKIRHAYLSCVILNIIIKFLIQSVNLCNFISKINILFILLCLKTFKFSVNIKLYL